MKKMKTARGILVALATLGTAIAFGPARRFGAGAEGSDDGLRCGGGT